MVGSAPTCRGRKENGEACRATPMRDGDHCFWHSPDHTEEAAEARRLGGLRRRRERAVAGAYDVGALDTVGAIRRVIEIVTLDALGMESTSVARGRLLIAAMQTATKLLETGELEERLSAVEQVLGPDVEKGHRG
jgi:CO/xanthine dehydrogenase FAD-binding subunit